MSATIYDLAAERALRRKHVRYNIGTTALAMRTLSPSKAHISHWEGDVCYVNTAGVGEIQGRRVLPLGELGDYIRRYASRDKWED